MESARKRVSLGVSVVLVGALWQGASASDVVLSTQGEYMDAYFEVGGVLQRKILVHPDDPDQVGRHLNGRVCFFPQTTGEFAGKFVVADDTYREACVDTTNPQARCPDADPNSPDNDPNNPTYVGNDPDGWGVFNADASWDKSVITTGTPSEPDYPGTADPQGCVFDANDNLIGNDVGGGDAGTASGNVIMFFAGADYQDFCFLATGLGQPGVPSMAEGALYVPQSGGGVITKFTGSFPAEPAHCTGTAIVAVTQDDDTVVGYTVPIPDAAHTPTRETFVVPGALTPISMARRPNALGIPPAPPSWYVASVLITPTILEVIETPVVPGLSIGVPVRPIALPFVPKNPIGMDVASDGTVYYAELNLTIPDLGTGCGRVSRVTFDPLTGLPSPPETIRENLQFPDGITIVDSSKFALDLSGLQDAPDFGPDNCGGE